MQISVGFRGGAFFLGWMVTTTKPILNLIFERPQQRRGNEHFQGISEKYHEELVNNVTLIFEGFVESLIENVEMPEAIVVCRPAFDRIYCTKPRHLDKLANSNIKSRSLGLLLISFQNGFGIGRRISSRNDDADDCSF